MDRRFRAERRSGRSDDGWIEAGSRRTKGDYDAESGVFHKSSSYYLTTLHRSQRDAMHGGLQLDGVQQSKFHARHCACPHFDVARTSTARLFPQMQSALSRKMIGRRDETRASLVTALVPVLVAESLLSHGRNSVFDRRIAGCARDRASASHPTMQQPYPAAPARGIRRARRVTLTTVDGKPLRAEGPGYGKIERKKSTGLPARWTTLAAKQLVPPACRLFGE
jgi:hypothetical protein